MDEKKYPLLISSREKTEWIPTCPAQVKHIRLERPAEDALPQIYITTVKCTEYNVTGLVLSIELQNSRRETIGKLEDIAVKIGTSGPIPCPLTDAVYAAAVVEEVTVAGGDTWRNEQHDPGIQLPKQDLFWNTDPLYEQIVKECEGVVAPRYKPDRIDGGWRCACGQVNLADSTCCGGCGCALSWLDTHLDRAYLEERLRIEREKTAEKKPAKKEKQKKKERALSDKAKAIFILAAVLALVLLIVLAFTCLIPALRYAHADSLAEKGEYDRSAAIFSDLGDFRDASQRAADVIYQKAQAITGLEEVVMTTSAQSPWYTISETGELSFNKTAYEEAGGDWNHIRLPDLVDGVMVTSLERNFFINCDQLLEVTLSDCIIAIGEQSFLGCESLQQVHLGKNLTTIGPRAFIDCYALEKIEIPHTVTTLGARAFNNCWGLKSVVLGEGITRLNDYLFSQCTSLRSLTLSAPITAVGEGVFTGCESLSGLYCDFAHSMWTEPEIGADNEAFLSAQRLFAE